MKMTLMNQVNNFFVVLVGIFFKNTDYFCYHKIVSQI